MTRRILLIDADPEFRANLHHHLARYRVDFVFEDEPDTAIAVATKQPPDLILLAAETDKIGFKTFGKIKKSPLAKTSIILATRSLAPEDMAKHRAMRVHADEYIDKRTLGGDELIDKIKRLVDLGEPSSDIDDIPVEIDDIALADGDMVLDETIGEDDAPRVDHLVAAETDAAFDALLGFDDLPAHQPADPPVVADAVPAPIPDRHDFDNEVASEVGSFDTFSRESIVLPKPEVPVVSEPAMIISHRFESSPAIQLDPDDLVEDDSGGIPEPVPHPMSQADADAAAEVAAAPQPILATLPKIERAVDHPAIVTGVHAVVDLGLDAIADASDQPSGPSDNSGVYDRRSLRKIHELERQIQQLKSELDRQRASAEAPGRGGSREREFVHLKSQLIAKDDEVKRAKSELEQRTRELGDAEELMRQAQQARMTIEAKAVELEQKVAADGSRASTFENRERALSAQLATLQQDLDHKSATLASAESARAQLERDLASERANRAASTSEAERSLRLDREQMVARHHSEVSGLRMEHAGATAIALEKQRQEHENVHAAALAAVQRERDAALEVSRQQLEQVRTESAAQLEATRQQHAATLDEARDTHAAELATARAQQAAGAEAAQRQLDMARAEHATTLQTHQAHHATELDTVRSEMQAAIEATRQEVAGEADAAVGQLEAQHATDIARLREDHGAALRERDHAMVKLRDEHGAALEQYAATLARVQEEAVSASVVVAAAHDRELGQLRGEAERARAELASVQAAHDQARSQLASEHAAELAALADQHAGTMADREREWSTQRQDEAIAHTAALAELKAELDKQTHHHGTRLDAAKAELDALIARHEHAQGALREDHERAVTEQEQAHAAALAAAAAEKQRALDDIARAQADHRAALDRTASQHRDELATLRDTAEREISEYRTALTGAKRALDDATARHVSERDTLDKDHAATLAEMKGQHERAMALANGEVIKVKAFADAEHNRTMAAKDADHDRVRKEMAGEHARVAGELTRERDELQRGLSNTRDNLKRLETEHASAVQTIADRNAELRQHTAAIAERDQRIADLRKEIETLEAENSSYQEQVLRAYQKIKADEAKSARAKKAMAVALIALDEEAAKTESS